MSRTHASRKLGFTLIELMIVVAILGILAAVAIPSFATYVRRSKTAEAYSTLDAMFKALSVYYNRDFAASDTIVSNIVGHCTVLEADTFPGDPTDYKQPFVSSPSFSMETGIALPTGTSYYKFTNGGGTTGCGKPASAVHYTLTARGDLDADGNTSMFSVLVAASSANELYRPGIVFVIDELE